MTSRSPMDLELSALPTEIIELFANLLHSTDLCSLRLACRALNSKTVSHFRRALFTTVRTNLSRESLRKLQDIARTEPLGRQVRTLLIKEYTAPCGQINLGRGFVWPRHPSGCLQDSPVCVQILRDILLNSFTNCTSFHIHGDCGCDDVYESDHLRPSDAVSIMLAIIAETGLDLKSFHLDFENGRIDVNRLHITSCRQPKFKEAWSHLQELCLEQTVTAKTFEWTMDLIALAPCVSKLSLSCHWYENHQFLIRRLSSTRLPTVLREFLLGCVYATKDMISSMLFDTRSSLRLISFRLVTIASGGSWKAVFRYLRIDFPNLKSISLLWLKDSRREETRHIMFPKLKENPEVPGSPGRKFEVWYKKWRGEPRLFGASYHGPEMGTALEILEKTLEYL